MPTRLGDEEIERELAKLDGWSRSGDSINAQFVFTDFGHAFGFMAEMAVLAEKLNHHPTWENTYNRVSVTLTTHDVDGLSEHDFTMAARMSAAASR